MPLIQISMGPSTTEQKRELIEKLTAVAIDITKIPANEFTVTIAEFPLENIGRAGKTVSDLRCVK